MVSIFAVVLNYTNYSQTIDCTNTLLNQKGVTTKVVIVDNDSPNNSYAEISKYFSGNEKVVVIRSKSNGGYAKGNNIGLRYIKDKPCDYTLIINNDAALPNKSTLKDLVKAYEGLENPGFVSPRLEGCNQPTVYKFPSYIQDLVTFLPPLHLVRRLFGSQKTTLQKESTMEGDVVCGAFVFSKKNVMFDVGMFDEQTFLYGEERILAHKAMKKGYKSYLINSCSYRHQQGSSTKVALTKEKTYRYLFQSLNYYYAHYAEAQLIQRALLKFAQHYFLFALRIKRYFQKRLLKGF